MVNKMENKKIKIGEMELEFKEKKIKNLGQNEDWVIYNNQMWRHLSFDRTLLHNHPLAKFKRVKPDGEVEKMTMYADELEGKVIVIDWKVR
jgi:hypothetical protein